MITIDPTAVVAVNPEDLMRCAVRIDGFELGRTQFPALAKRISRDFKWSRSYGLSVAARVLAWGRYLADPQADRSLAPVLTLIAAASAPLTLERGFDVGVLEHSACEVLKQGAFTYG